MHFFRALLTSTFAPSRIRNRLQGAFMAQKTRVILVDDIEGNEITDGSGETLQFGLDGVTYEIDLTDRNASKLRDALSFYIAHARRTGGRRQTGRGNSTGSGGSNRSDLQKIREWAKENGYKVSDRGRISKEVQEAYAAAN
jgi:hypothetical protein